MSRHEHPGAVLRRYLDALGASQAELARAAGVSAKHLSQLVTGQVPMSADIAVRLEKALHATALRRWRAEQWMAMQGHYDVEMARLRAEAEREESS